MKAAAAVAEILKREGVEFLIGYPVNPIIEAAAEADIRTIIVRQERTGLHMADAVSRVTSGRPDRRLRHAARARHRERLRRRRAGLRRLRADRRPAGRLPAAASPASRPTSTRTLNFQHVTKWAEQVMLADAVPGRDAARLHPGQERPPAPGAGRDSRRRLQRGGAGAAATTSRRRALRIGARPEGRGARSRACWSARRAAGDLRRPGRALRARPGRSCASWPSCSRRRSRRACRARAPSRRTIRCRSAPAAGRSASSSTTSCTNADVIFGIGCSFAHDELRRGHAEGQDDRSTRRSTPPTSTRTSRPSTALIGDAGLTLDALLAEVNDRLKGKPRGRLAARDPGDRDAQGGVARPSGCRSSPQTSAPLSPYRVIWDLHAHGRRREHDHHPRRRQPARPALAVLGADRRR